MIENMKSGPLVSIIVLIYNNYNILEKNIKSILNQDYRNIELVIADDGSKNYNKNYIEKLLEGNELSRTIIYSNSENVGTVRNYNNAIKKSSGQIIVPLAADDCFTSPSFISKLVSFFEKEKCLVCTCKRIGEITRKILPNENDIQIMKTNDKVFNRLCYQGLYSGSVLYFDRRIFDLVGFFDEKYYLVEDYPYSIKLYMNDIEIKFFDIVSIEYGESGISSKKIEKKSRIALDYIKVLQYLLENKKYISNKKCLKYLVFQYDLYKHNKLVLFIKHPILFCRRATLKLMNRNIDYYSKYLEKVE